MGSEAHESDQPYFQIISYSSSLRRDVSLCRLLPGIALLCLVPQIGMLRDLGAVTSAVLVEI